MKKIGLILLILIIIVFNFVIGANEKGLRIEPIGVLMTLIIIYLIIRKIKEPEKSIFFKSKIDCLVLAFMLTTTLPFVFKTYCSYSDTVEFILKYFFIYSVYILARNVITEKKDINYIINATLICSLIPVILGLDYINGKYLGWIVEKLDLIYTSSYLFSGTFGYANAVAIYMSSCLFLSIYQIQKCGNKVLKIVYVIYGIFITYIIWLTLSRAIIALLAFVLLIYFILINRSRIKKHWKKIFIAIFLLLIIVIPLMNYALHISAPFTISKKSYGHRLDYDFEPEVKYKLELDIESNIEIEGLKDIAFELQIVQANKYFIESKIAYKKFGRMNGKLTIEFTPQKDFSHLNLRISNEFQGTFTIRTCYINGEEYILNYKYLPNQLGKIFSEYKHVFNQKSIKERIYMYKDCLEIAKDSPLIGQGGNTWQNLSGSVQDYTVILKETHSYFFELLISYGIIGVLSFLVMTLGLFIKLFKQLKNNEEARKDKLLIVIGLFFLLIYSLVFDFTMSFMLIQLIVYIYIAILLYDEQKEIKIPKIIEYIIVLLLLIVLSAYVRNNVAKYIAKDIEAKQSIASFQKKYTYGKIQNDIKNGKDYKRILNSTKELINTNPYYNQTEVYEIYFDQICKNMESIDKEELENYLDFGINKLKSIKFSQPLFIEQILIRTSIIEKMIKKIEEYKSEMGDNTEFKEMLEAKEKELQDIINQEYEINIKNLEDKEKLNYSDSVINMIKNEYLKMINKNDK